MNELIPIRTQEHLQLQALGINPAFIGFTTLTMESDKYICVREKVGEANQLVIVDLSDINNLVKRPITADSAIMHLTQKIIALKAGRQLQIFNLETKAKVKSHLLSEDVIFWKWINPTALGLVTEKAVFHWSLKDDGAPVKIFDRHASLEGCQIINYRVNTEMNWMMLIGISAKNDRVVGSMQLYNKDRKVSQPIEAHAASFAEFMLDGASSPTKLFSFAVRTATGAKLHIVEIDRNPNNPAFPKKQVDVLFPPEATSDFPVAMQVNTRQAIIYLVTKYGFVHLYDLATGDLIYCGRVSGETIFVTAEFEELGGIISVNRKGQVFSVSLDGNAVVPYILRSSNNVDLALRLASRCNLPGAEELYVRKYNQLLATGAHGEAAKLAATSPNGILRTPQTIEQFKQLPATPGQTAPILQYFGVLLERDSLNHFESLELARPVLQQGRKQLLEKWIKENKLTPSEELGDIIKQHDTTLALSIYLRANVSAKVVACFAEMGEYNKIVLYANRVGYQPDYLALLQHTLRNTPDKAADFAARLVNNEAGGEPLLEIERIMDVFTQFNMVQAATSFLLDALKGDRPDQGPLQTRLLEMTLLNAPQVADAILGNEMFHHYDRAAVAHLCERAGLLQRALEHYSDLSDIKRIVVHTHLLAPEWVLSFFGRLSDEDSMSCLQEMLRANLRQNLQTAVQVAIKYSDVLTPARLAELFESHKAYEGLYYYTGAIVNSSQDPEVHFKYIQAACYTGQLREVERICRESDYYDGERVKNFLKEANLQDLLPLIIVCDRFDFVHDLVLYLYQNNFYKYIETYVQKVNASRTPVVIGALLDVDCDEGIVKNLLMSVQGAFPVDELVEEVERRNRLKLLRPWLEARLNSGNQDTAVYNALAMIYIDGNNNAEQFLRSNRLYDPRIVGRYCEKRDPHLAFVAYEQGRCDEEVLQLTNENAMLKHQARYLMMRRDLPLWATVLEPANRYRAALVEQLSSVIGEAQTPEEVSFAVKALMAANMPHELLALLEKVMLELGMFSDNPNLQNLIMITAINHCPNKVMGYAERLNNYGVADVAAAAVQQQLFEEAFFIYNRYGLSLDAVRVLLDHLHDVDRAYAFAERINSNDVWSRLGQAQLAQSRVKEAVDSYLRSNDPSNYLEVIRVAHLNERYEDLVRYLQMGRFQAREPVIDSELLFALAKTNRLADLEAMLGGPNLAQVQKVGERCFAEELYHAAKLLFASVSNWGSLASTLVRLGEYQAAVDCARKANTTRVWRQVHDVCVEQGEFRLAQLCGLNLVVHADELQHVVRLYEGRGLIHQLLDLIEASLPLERAHMGMFTELTVLYTKHRPEATMGHLKLYYSRINIPKAIRACEEAHLWNELVFLYAHYDEHDNAVNVMIKHSAVAWDHAGFKGAIAKASNLEIYYRALQFYLDEHPTLATDLLTVLAPRVDHARVVQLFQKKDSVALIKPYLVSVQKANNRTVNNAYHQLLIEEEDYVTLRASIDQYDNFDTIELAQRLEAHELLEFRRIAAHLYRVNQRWEKSIELSKSDKLFEDALDTARDSGAEAVVEALLEFFVESKLYERFAAALVHCYDLIRPDVALELAWRHRIADYAMPYLLQVIREYTQKVDRLEKAEQARARKEEANAKQQHDAPIIQPGALGNPLMLTQGPSAMALAPPGYPTGGPPTHYGSGGLPPNRYPTGAPL
ncbi:Clathrin heavy chain [Massospora cicadina]|nr:Clathrin heavy chain [Massospora cicadina]